VDYASPTIACITSSLADDAVARRCTDSRNTSPINKTRIITAKDYKSFHGLVADQQRIFPITAQCALHRSRSSGGAGIEARFGHGRRSGVAGSRAQSEIARWARSRRDRRRHGTGPHAIKPRTNKEYFRLQPTVATRQPGNHPISRTIPINSSSLDACLKFAQHAFSLKRFEGALSPMSKYDEDLFSYPYASIDDLFFLSKPHAPPRPPPQR
jgi:hypothetical protein